MDYTEDFVSAIMPGFCKLGHRYTVDETYNISAIIDSSMINYHIEQCCTQAQHGKR